MGAGSCCVKRYAATQHIPDPPHCYTVDRAQRKGQEHAGSSTQMPRAQLEQEVCA